ncbi:OmpA family protein [Nocardiopsis coralliicola]
MSQQRFRRSVLLVLPAFLLTACVSGGSEGDGSGGSGEDGGQGPGSPAETTLESLSTATVLGPDFQVNVNSLERHSEDTLVLTMTAENNGDEDVTVSELFSYPSRANGARKSASGVSLVDTANFNRHRPYLYDEGEPACLCSEWDDTRLAAGDELEFWVAFPAPPDEVESMTVNTTITPDFQDVPIVNAKDPDQEIISTERADGIILPIRSFEDESEGGTSREETADETSVMLSSDVLFDLNESKLTSAADEELEKVAEEVDASSATTISIDGYTDDSGDDSINVPLSEDRSESVKNRLEDLVERSDVEFETAGHGSSDPVADNGTEEGREKNRRVTVTFERGE